MVERQLERMDDGEVKFAPPKTRFGRRNVALGTQTISVLRSHNERQFALRKAAGDKWMEHDLIFTNRYGGPIHYRNLLRDFKIILYENSLPEIRFHDLRHTAASLMLNQNTLIMFVSRRLGHARASITLDVYGHLVPGMQAEVAEKMDELITPVELHQTAPEIHQISEDLD